MAILLELDLTTGVVEDLPSNPLERFVARHRAVLFHLVQRIDEAKDDGRVVGILAKVGGSRISLAHAQELRDAIVRFRGRGKPAIAWAETFGEAGHGVVPYVLASGFDEVWLQPSGSVGLMGAVASSVFVRDALDNVRIEPLVHQRHEYKNAADSLLRNDFTESHREATERLATSIYEQIVGAVSDGRRLPHDVVRRLVDEAPIDAADALEAKLVDQLGYRDAVRRSVDQQFSASKPELLYASRYRRRGSALGKARKQRAPSVGLVQLGGPIRQGRSIRGLVGRAAGSDTVTAAIRSAVGDKRVKALVLRVDSPGGSYVASDAIWREVCQARDKGVPVIASMGDVAGSGGYYVAMGADAIVAQPATLTGSIGVVGGKLRTSGLFDHLGAHVRSVAVGKHASMFSPTSGFSDEDWEKLDAWLDAVYEDFTAKVGQGRGMSREAVDEVARGRVWTGADALARGLVDELGGLHRAVEIARERSGLAPDAPVRPLPVVSPLRSLRAPRNSDDVRMLATSWGWEALASASYAGGWGAYARLAAHLGFVATGPLTML